MRRFPNTRPLSGTEAPVRGLFIDRWGTLIASESDCLGPKSVPWTFVTGAVDAMFRAQQAGWLIYLIGNETAVAHGLIEERFWLEQENEMLARLASHGVRITRNYACLEHPAGKGSHRRPSVFLLPDTGIFYHALQMDGVVLDQCWVVGDGTLELAAGERAGMRTAGVRTGRALGDGELAIEPRFVAEDVTEFIGTLLGPRVGAA